MDMTHWSSELNMISRKPIEWRSVFFGRGRYYLEVFGARWNSNYMVEPLVVFLDVIFQPGQFHVHAIGSPHPEEKVTKLNPKHPVPHTECATPRRFLIHGTDKSRALVIEEYVSIDVDVATCWSMV